MSFGSLCSHHLPLTTQPRRYWLASSESLLAGGRGAARCCGCRGLYHALERELSNKLGPGSLQCAGVPGDLEGRARPGAGHLSRRIRSGFRKQKRRVPVPRLQPHRSSSQAAAAAVPRPDQWSCDSIVQMLQHAMDEVRQWNSSLAGMRQHRTTGSA